jgi:hypothetical protein
MAWDYERGASDVKPDIKADMEADISEVDFPIYQ